MNSRRNLFLFFIVFSACFTSCNVDVDSWVSPVDGTVTSSGALFSFDYTNTCSCSRAPRVVRKGSECVMTVFMHGTVGPHPTIMAVARWIKNMFQGKRSAKGIGAHQEYIEQVKRSGIHRWQPINSLGLVEISLDKELPRKDFGYIGQKTAEFYGSVRDFVNLKNKNKVDKDDKFAFYTFSWSGRLSHKHRLAAARDLYELIGKEVKKLSKKFGLPVKIHMLAHSHGCNVVLNLDRIEKKLKKNIVIDKAIFFGGPIQSETEPCIKSKIFKKIYNIFSCGDHMQRLDFVSTQDRFSRRAFGTDLNNPVCLPKNLYQIDVELGGCHPFHYELWLWGRKSFPYVWYRRKVPLHPLPLSVFTPVIISLVDSASWDSVENRICKLKFDEKKSMFLLCDNRSSPSCKIDMWGMKQKAYGVL